MFLVILSECETYHDVSPIDRGLNGQQLRFPYTSPRDSEHYGSISLTFYPTTSRLLVQGSSYLLWVDEHLPVICEQAEHRYLQSASTWTALARRWGIGLKREGRNTRQTRSLRSTRSNDLAQASLALPSNDLSEKQESGTSPPLYSNGVTLTDAPLSPSPTPHTALAAITAAVPVPHALQSPCTDLEVTTGVTVGEETLSATSACADSTVHPVQSQNAKPTSKVSSKTKRPKKKNSSKTKKTVLFCLPEKSTNGHGCSPECNLSDTCSNMIRCSLCMAWYHIECAGEDASYNGVWCCNSCRTLPLSIHDLTEQVKQLASSVETIQSRELALKSEVQQLKAENGKLHSKLTHSVQHTNELAKLIETMSFPSTRPTDVTGSDDCDGPSPPDQSHLPPPVHTSVAVPTANRFEALSDISELQRGSQSSQGRRSFNARDNYCAAVTSSAGSSCSRKDTTVTVIGSSIVRGVAPLVHGKRFAASGFVYPGHTARQINSHIRHIPDSDVTVLAAGTNNIEHQTVAECTQELHQVIDNVARKKQGKTVIMSLLPYRYDKPELCKKILLVNDFICKEIRKHRHWYTLRHSLSREDFKQDGLHFNSHGTAKYAHEIRHIVRSIKVE